MCVVSYPAAELNWPQLSKSGVLIWGGKIKPLLVIVSAAPARFRRMCLLVFLILHPPAGSLCNECVWIVCMQANLRVCVCYRDAPSRLHQWGWRDQRSSDEPQYGHRWCLLYHRDVAFFDWLTCWIFYNCTLWISSRFVGGISVPYHISTLFLSCFLILKTVVQGCGSARKNI